MSRLQIASAVVVSAVSLLAPSLARAACSMDAECKGERICVEGRCVDPQPKAAPVVPIAAAPAPRPVSSPSSSSQPPAPPPAPPSVSAAPAAEPTVTVAQPSSGGGLLQSGSALGWSVSLLGSATSLSLPQGNLAGFQTDAHLQVLARLAPPVSFVGYFDSSLPLTQVRGQIPFELNTLGVGVGVGDRYRVMVGGGLTSTFSFLDANIYMGGQFMVHGSVPLIDGVGLHAQFSVTAVAGLTLIQGGLGIGYQG